MDRAIPVPVAVYIQARMVVFTRVREAASILVRVAVCTPVPEVGYIQARVVVYIQAPAAAFTQVPAEASTRGRHRTVDTAARGARALLGYLVASG